MVGLTLAVAIVIAAPTGFWLGGATPTTILVVSTLATALTIGLYGAAARFIQLGRLWAVGLLSGLIGSLLTQITWQVHPARLATAFAAYASFGPTLYRLNVLKPWWAFAFVGLMGLFYMGIALGVRHVAIARPKIATHHDTPQTM